MINLIVGANASGKTLTLKRMVNEHAVQGCSYSDSPIVLESIKLNECALEIASEFLEGDALVYNNSVVGVTPWFDNPIEFSRLFLDRVNLVCKNTKYVFLDEPDFGITDEETRILAHIIESISRELEKEFWITCHCDSFVSCGQTRFFHVIDGVLEEGDESLGEILLSL